MGEVRTFIVTEKRNFTLGIGDVIFECLPGTVLYEPWLEDAAGMSTYRLEHLGLIAASGVADEDDVPDSPGFVHAEIDGVTHVGPTAPEADASEAPEGENEDPAKSEGPEASAGGGAGDGSATGDDSQEPASDVAEQNEAQQADILASLHDEFGKPVDVPDGGDANTAEPQILDVAGPATEGLPLYTHIAREGGELADPTLWPRVALNTVDGEPLFQYTGDMPGEPATVATDEWVPYTGETVAIEQMNPERGEVRLLDGEGAPSTEPAPTEPPASDPVNG